jgi:hypothetical protein
MLNRQELLEQALALMQPEQKEGTPFPANPT